MAEVMRASIAGTVPDLDDLARYFPKHRGLADGPLGAVFDLVRRPENAWLAVRLLQLGVPAVTAIADDVRRLYKEGNLAGQYEWNQVKQFAGVCVATMVLVNGYKNAHAKRSVPCEGWNVGAMFEPREEVPPSFAVGDVVPAPAT